MIYKLKTSSETQTSFAEIQNLYGLQPYILSKIAIALSIKKGKLESGDFGTNTNGLELNRQTIFGELDTIYRCLIAMNEGKSLTDEEYFPKLVKAHLDRGARLLSNESKYSRDLYISLCHLDENL